MQEVECAAEVGGKQTGDKAQADDWFTCDIMKKGIGVNPAHLGRCW